jgi:hypothetical protein
VIRQYSSISCLRLLLPSAVRRGPARNRPQIFSAGAPRGKAIGRPRMAAPVRAKIPATYQASGAACGSWRGSSASGARLCGASCVVATRGPLPLVEIVVSEHNFLPWMQKIPLGRMAPTVRICRG